ncbi:MAG: ketoacyl-ACP synthase III [Proteobacteria bacterium]|nr:ketoacyl-ACP synthase III [Pseudomonadota bacterium]
MRAKIAGTGSYVPEKVLTNKELESMVDTTDEWITTRTGIRERRIAVSESSTDMAVHAAERALKSAGVSAADIELVVVGTVTPEMTFPSTACFVQSRLGIKSGVPAFDLSAACSGFLYALDVAEKYIVSGIVKRALVIGVDRFSEIIDWTDRSTCVLFGDGAGAVVLSGTKGKSGIMASNIHSDGRKWDMLYAPGKGRCPFGKENAKKDSDKTESAKKESAEKETPPYLAMSGNETFKVAVRTMVASIKEALKAAKVSADDVKLLIPHQANQRIIEATRQRLKLPKERLFMNLDKYGNTSAGSIPIALDEAYRQGRIKRGDIILFVAFGGGLTWSSAALRW